jgi:hypothetical protein
VDAVKSPYWTTRETAEFLRSKVPDLIGGRRLHEVDPPAPRPRIYFLVSGRRIVYVGKTWELHQRLRAHAVAGRDFDRVFYFCVKPEEMDEIERRLIVALSPRFNQVGVPGRRIKRRTGREIQRDIDGDVA